MQIRLIEAEQTWQIRQEVLWANQSLEFSKLAEDEIGNHYGVFENELLVSVISCFEKGKELQFRKFATLEAWQGKGYGSFLLNFIFEKAKNDQIQRIWCNARTQQIHFYQKFGMSTLGKTFTKTGVEYIAMEFLITKFQIY